MRTSSRILILLTSFVLSLHADAYPSELNNPALPAIPAKLTNPWPQGWETEFQQRAQLTIKATASPSKFGNTFFENEKRSYPNAMLAILGGYKSQGIAFLQEEDNKARDWNQHTLGIDYFPAFTLKHQIRKLFHFGHLLDPAYRQRMIDAAKIFTAQDPYRRPHHAYRPGNTGWTPEAHNSWVDIRNTDNLFLMRATSIYLLAEISQNHPTRLLYQSQIENYVRCLHHVGMAEWDSENYHSHSIAPLLNLYDFTTDNHTRAIAKAGLDWLFTAAALKYHRGILNGPSKRDYNQPAPLSGGAARFLWLYFADTPQPPTHHEHDIVHAITSRYRPPAAAVLLAHNPLSQPTEVLSAKPHYQVWQNDWSKAQPTYYETQYISRSFRFGTLLQGTQDPDVNGFKITTHSTQHGAQSITAAPCSDPLKLASPQYTPGILAPGTAVAQNHNLAIHLTAPSAIPIHWWIPTNAIIHAHPRVLLLHIERTAIAIWPINSSLPTLDAAATRLVQNVSPSQPRWPTIQAFRSHIIHSSHHYGFAIEVIEAPDSQTADAFFQKAKSTMPELDELASRAAVAMTGPGLQHRLRLQWGSTPQTIKVWKNGKALDIVSDPAVYRSSLLSQPWQSGRLRLSIEDHTITSQIPSQR